MSIIFWATIILFSASLIFYIVFFSLIYYWHETRVSYIILPLLFTFEFFIVGFFVLAILMLIINYLPSAFG